MMLRLLFYASAHDALIHGATAANGREEMHFAPFGNAIQQSQLAHFTVDNHGQPGGYVIRFLVVQQLFNARMQGFQIVDDLTHRGAGYLNAIRRSGNALHLSWYPHVSHFCIH